MNYKLAIAFISSTLLAIVQLPAAAQVDETIKSGPQINEISQRTTLLIIAINEEGVPEGSGSGSLIAKQNNSCIGVTNAHVVETSQGQSLSFVVQTFDGENHLVGDVHVFPNEDLAIVEFPCQQNYEPIPLATYQLSPGQPVYLSGWPGSSTPEGNIVRQFTSGSISTILERPYDGYQIGYTNVTRSGMSGGQVLDEAGRLVAIHGLGTQEKVNVRVSESVVAELVDKTGFNYGIPVTTLLARASQMGLNYPVTVAYSSPQEPTNGSTVAQGEYVYQPGANDQVNFNSVMDGANRLLDTVGRGAVIFCTFLGC